MAKKENEENKDVNQESEEDFGLPDLEFEELDDIDEEEFDEADLENVEEEIAELIGETPDEDELSLEDIGADTDDSADAPAAVSDSDVTASEGDTLEDIGISEEQETTVEESDALPPIEDELQKETIDEELDEVEKFISEITADDVEEDSGGAPVGMFATDRSTPSEEEPAEVEPSYEASGDEGGTSKGFTRVIIFGLLGAVLIAFGFLYFHNESGGSEPLVAEAESEPAETAPAVEEEPAETQPVEEEPVVEEPVQEAPPSTAATANPGTITAITASAGRYYVVVGSFIDDDMANDYGKELAAQGASVKIISPFNERKFFRVSIADYGTRDEAVSATEQLKTQYGDDIWALKY